MVCFFDLPGDTKSDRRDSMQADLDQNPRGIEKLEFWKTGHIYAHFFWMNCSKMPYLHDCHSLLISGIIFFCVFLLLLFFYFRPVPRPLFWHFFAFWIHHSSLTKIEISKTKFFSVNFFRFLWAVWVDFLNGFAEEYGWAEQRKLLCWRMEVPFQEF